MHITYFIEVKKSGLKISQALCVHSQSKYIVNNHYINISIFLLPGEKSAATLREAFKIPTFVVCTVSSDL